MKAETEKLILASIQTCIDDLEERTIVFASDLRRMLSEIPAKVPRSAIVEEIKNPVARQILQVLSELANTKTNGVHPPSFTKEDLLKEADRIRDVVSQERTNPKPPQRKPRHIEGFHDLRVAIAILLQGKHHRSKITTGSVISDLESQGYAFNKKYVSRILGEFLEKRALSSGAPEKKKGKDIAVYYIDDREALVPTVKVG